MKTKHDWISAVAGGQTELSYEEWLDKQPAAEHTPGPWTWNRLSPDSTYARISGCGWDDFASVAIRISPDTEDYPEGLANLRLILAAPELLRIARAYRNLLRVSASTDGDLATFAHIESVLSTIE